MIGGVGFEHVFAFQIKCMMQGQYFKLVQATTPDDVIVACLRLGWNDAFRQTSRNADDFNKKSEKEKSKKIDNVCEEIVEDFKKYAEEKDTAGRVDCIHNLLKNDTFRKTIARVKDVTNEEHPLCLGHIQKMFNVAIKLLLCLLISAEYAANNGLNIELCNGVYLDQKAFLTFNNETFKKIAFDTADCPLDSIILSKISQKTNITSVTWSKLGANKANPDTAYQDIQNAIADNQAGTGKSNLCFDFENWNG